MVHISQAHRYANFVRSLMLSVLKIAFEQVDGPGAFAQK